MADKNMLFVIIGIAIALLLTGILLPIGLTDLTAYDGTYNASYVDGTETLYESGTNATMATLVGTVLPIMIVIAIVLSLVAVMNEKQKRGKK